MSSDYWSGKIFEFLEAEAKCETSRPQINEGSNRLEGVRDMLGSNPTEAFNTLEEEARRLAHFRDVLPQGAHAEYENLVKVALSDVQRFFKNLCSKNDPQSMIYQVPVQKALSECTLAFPLDAGVSAMSDEVGQLICETSYTASIESFSTACKRASGLHVDIFGQSTACKELVEALSQASKQSRTKGWGDAVDNARVAYRSLVNLSVGINDETKLQDLFGAVRVLGDTLRDIDGGGYNEIDVALSSIRAGATLQSIADVGAADLLVTCQESSSLVPAVRQEIELLQRTIDGIKIADGDLEGGAAFQALYTFAKTVTDAAKDRVNQIAKVALDGFAASARLAVDDVLRASEKMINADAWTALAAKTTVWAKWSAEAVPIFKDFRSENFSSQLAALHKAKADYGAAGKAYGWSTDVEFVDEMSTVFQSSVLLHASAKLVDALAVNVPTTKLAIRDAVKHALDNIDPYGSGVEKSMLPAALLSRASEALRLR
ncbi:unnamed protein product [Prorocentrum cordatum]|uniref:Uncharacterized protein n=1 Tax=Prorocentrum cordatum TaxID=2364126 RepID=A0ABN9YD99_9DINO|nr:unnamed protein product [Polarella glacialis]